MHSGIFFFLINDILRKRRDLVTWTWMSSLQGTVCAGAVWLEWNAAGSFQTAYPSAWGWRSGVWTPVGPTSHCHWPMQTPTAKSEILPTVDLLTKYHNQYYFFDRVLKLRNWTAKRHYSNRHKSPKQQKLMDKYLTFSGYRGDNKLYICIQYISLVWWIPENLTSLRVVWFEHTQMNRMSPILFLIVDY